MGNLVKQGITFPIEIDNGTHKLVDKIELVRNSLRIIIAWPKGSMYFNDWFGSDSHKIIEEPNDSLLESMLRVYLIDAIQRCEPRVELRSLEVIRQNDLISLQINAFYTIKEINYDDNLQIIIQP